MYARPPRSDAPANPSTRPAAPPTGPVALLIDPPPADPQMTVPPPPPPPDGDWMPPGWPPPRRPVLPFEPAGGAVVLIAAAATGVALDLAGLAGSTTISGTLLVACLSAGLLASGRVRGRVATGMVAGAALLALVLTWRASPWVIVPAVLGIGALLLVGTSVGSGAGRLPATPSEAVLRMATSACHVTLGPSLLGAPAGAGPRARRRMPALVRGALLSIVIAWPLMALLTSADPVLRSWLDLSGAVGHGVRIVVGGWLLLGLVRAASSRRSVPVLEPRSRVGRTEAACALASVAALYALFVVAQLVAVLGGAEHVIETSGLTYAEYARSGFFQLLACAALTLVVLLALRFLTGKEADSPVLRALAALVAVLTVGIVITAVERLRLYESAYGLTMLRLAALVASAWIGAMFLVLAARSLRPAMAPHLPAVALGITLAVLVGWTTTNPPAMVARTNLDRATVGLEFDAMAAADLGDDAVPALVDGAASLQPQDRAALFEALCRRRATTSGGFSYNASRQAATDARLDVCAVA